MSSPPHFEPLGVSPEPARAAAWPLRAAASVYGAGARLHRASYARGWLRQRQLACAVLSVGSLTVGGAGKTPTAAWIAAGLAARGRRVVLATRGYGRAVEEPVSVVSDGRWLRATPPTAGDEPLVLAAHAPGVPVLAGRDRGLAGLRAVSAYGADLLVLDDGFQHHRLRHDLEVLTFDAREGLGNRTMLPGGPLRERPSELRRAHAIGVVDGELDAADEALLEEHGRLAYRYSASRRPRALTQLGRHTALAAEALHGMRVGVLCGLASPAGFERSLESLGALIVARCILPDHHRYRIDDLRSLHADADCWVTTEKDAVKIPPGWLGSLDLRVLTMELEVERGDELLDWIEVRLASI
jgi:tetraacyldisaccharide 4'-kinase